MTISNVIFTFDWYSELLKTLSQDGHKFKEFYDSISEKSIVLRHDVDWSPRKAVRLAEIEASYGINSTYFFLVTSPFYNPMNKVVRECIYEITELGHDIGLHFSTHQYFESEPNGADGREPRQSDLVTAINQEREILSTVASGEPIDVVSFHNPPEWVLRQSFGDFVSTYETRFFDEVAYIADSNQRWRNDPPFDDGIPSKIQILTHPVLWGEQDAFATDRLREEKDYLSNQIGRYLEETDRTWEGLHGISDDWIC